MIFTKVTAATAAELEQRLTQLRQMAESTRPPNWLNAEIKRLAALILSIPVAILTINRF